MAKKRKADDFDSWLSSQDNDRQQTDSGRPVADDFSAWYQKQQETPVVTRYITATSEGLRRLAEDKARRRSSGSDAFNTAIKRVGYRYNENNWSQQRPDGGDNPKTRKYYLYNENNWNRQVPDGGEKQKQKTYYPYNQNNWNGAIADTGDGKRGRKSSGTDAPYALAPETDIYEQRRAGLGKYIQANKVAAGDRVIKSFSDYGWNDEPVVSADQMTRSEKPKFIQNFEAMSSAEIKERRDLYKQNVSQDLTIARNLLQGTFAGVSPSYSRDRENIGLKYGIDANDPEALRQLVDRLERGVLYTDENGNETTFDKLYNSALNREREEQVALPPEEQNKIASLYAMSSDELEKEFHALDDETRQGDINLAENLLNYSVPWFEYDEQSDVGQARAYLKETYGIDAANETELRNLITDLKKVNGNVIYTDSNGRAYTYQDLYYNAENREQFGRLEGDEGALELLREGLRLQKEIDRNNAYIMDEGTAAMYSPVVTDLGNKKNIIADRLAEKGYDLDRMIGYLNTEEAKQRFIMQSQATAAWTEEHPVLANIASMLSTPVQAVEWAANRTGSGNPEDLKNYVPKNYFGMDATNFSSTVRSTTSEMIQNEMLSAGFSDTFANLAAETYSGILSATQSRILALVCTAMFGPAGEGVSLMIMGSSAASEALREGIDRGLDNGHAIATAIASGINEVLFEKISLENYLKNTLDLDRLPETLLEALKKSQYSRLIEGSEEIFTDIANSIADGLINGDMSQYKTKIRTYMSNGLEYGDAVNKANEEYLSDILQSGFGGYIGGGGTGAFIMNAAINSGPFQSAMSPIADAVNRYEQNRAYENIGGAVIGNQNTDELVNTAMQSGNVDLQSLASEVAASQEVQKPSRKQQKVFQKKVGQLASETVKANVQKATGSQVSTIRATIKSELDARSIKPTDRVIDVVEKVYNNEELNADEKSIAASVKASDIAGSLQERSAEIEAEASRTSTEALKRASKVRDMVADLGDKVSENGQAIDRNTGKAVEIDEVASVEKNDDGGYSMTLKLADGSRVNSDDLQYANSTQATLYEAVRAAGMNAEIGNAIIRAFDKKGTSAAFSYVQGMVEGLNYGRTNQTAEMASKDTFFADLTEPQKNLALQLGQMENQTAISEAAARISSLRNITKNPRRVGSIDVRSDMAGLNNAQRTGIRTIEMLVDDGVLTNNFHFFSSAEGARGRVLTEDIGGLKKGDSAPNGFYDPKTGDIYIDVNAGNSGEGTVLFTAAHELTHFVKQWSPQKFNDLASFLVNEYHGAGVSVDSMVRNQQRKGSGRNLSYNDAFEEFVADSMQTMFTDGSLAARLEKLRNTDKTLFDKIVDFIKKLQKGINKVYARYTPDSEEAKALSKIKGAVDRLADTFAEGITEATENYNVTDASNLSAKEIAELDKKGFAVTNGLIVAKNMEAIASRVQKPGALNIYSYRTEPEWEKSVIAQWGDTEETRRYINAVRAFTDAMVSDDAIRRVVPMGSYAYDKYGPLRDNVEYVITFDMDTSCPRTFQFTKYRDHLQAYAKRPLTYKESVNLLELMRAYGQNIPCSYCYVENKRVLLSASYNNFFKFRNDVLNEKDPKKAMKKMYGYNSKNGTLADASQKVFDRWRSDMNYNPTIQEIWSATQTARNSVFNFLDNENERGNIDIKKSQKTIEELVCDHFGVKGQTPRAEISGFVSEWIYDTFAEKEHTYLQKNDPSVSEVDVRALALNHEALAYAKSASSAKTVSSYVPYTDQLKNIPQDVKDYVIGMGGIRKHSSNDFRIDYVQDYLMFYADLAAGGWTGHTYTKSPDYVKIFGNTGDRINMSIAMTDGPNGQVRENALEGMYWSVARELRKAYKNAGVMSMVTSDAQLSYALNADWIDMIIPFHASSLDKQVWYNLRHWFDYTSKQLERFYSSKDMKLALIQKALDDAGVEYSSDAMKQKLIAMAKEKGAGALSKDTDKIKQAEISRLVKIAAKNGVQFNNKMSTKEIEAAYNSAFGVKTLYNSNGKRIKPHFLPGETVVDGVTIPGHNNDVNRYLELCREYGVHPRFDGVAVQDKNGNDINVIDHEGYLKLIKETARTDSEQEKIQFNFDKYDEYLKMTPMEYAMQQLHDNADIGMYDNMSEDPMGIQKKFIDNYLGKDRPIGWLTEEAQDYMEMREEDQAKLNTGDVDELPGYEGIKQSARDQDYMDAVNSGDMETAQNMVDQAAKDAGYNVKGYHGTSEIFTVFDKSFRRYDGGKAGFIYITPSAKYADIYAAMGTEDDGDTDESSAYVMNLFAKAQNPLELGEINHSILNFEDDEFSPRVNEIARLVGKNTQEFVDEIVGENDYLLDEDLWVLVNTPEFANMVIAKGYDSVHMTEGGNEAYGVANESQVKSADPVTYDNAGNVIPLSERFNEGNMDIRYSVREENVQPDDTGFLYSTRITDQDTLKFLDNQKHVTVYRAMQEIDGKLYPPMTAYTRDENGRKVMRPAAEIGNWYQSVERPDLIDPKTGKFKLEKGDTDAGKGSDVNAAYNPYFHTSLSILNDQFSSAWDRSNMVVVEGEVPVSELTSGYKAQYAKDAVGKTKWHSGPVATELNRIGKPREVILSRYFKPVRVIGNAEAAQSIADTLKGTDIQIPENVVSPKLLTELKKLGVKISAPKGLSKDQVEKHYNRVDAPKFSDRDSDGSALTPSQQEFFKASKARDKNGKLLVLYSGTGSGGFTQFNGNKIWMTTEYNSARAYGGAPNGKVFAPDRKTDLSTKEYTAPNDRVIVETDNGNEFVFDSVKDRQDFEKNVGGSVEDYIDRFTYDDLRDDAEWNDASQEELNAIDKRRDLSKKIETAYKEYDRKHVRRTSLGDMLANPDGYSKSDFLAAARAWDKEVSVDGPYTKQDIIDVLTNDYEENRESSEQSLYDYWHDVYAYVRIPAGATVTASDAENLNTVYKMYANIKNPYIVDNSGMRLNEDGSLYYKAVDYADQHRDRYDGVIITNVEVGPVGSGVGTTVVAFNANQVKSVNNLDPTENNDIRFSDRDNYFDQTFETMEDGRIRPRNVEDLSTEDWTIIYKTMKKLGYGIVSAKDAKAAYSKYVGTSGWNKEQSEALKKAYGVSGDTGTSANPARVAAAKKEFGLTTNYAEAGYILPDGKMLDFSGKREGGPSGVRYMDHREIARVFESMDNSRYGGNTQYMDAFINEGNIRLMDGQGVTIGETEPTANQYKMLKPFIDRQLRNEDFFYLDLSNKDGYTIESREYGPGDTSSKIINEIKAYFKNGELPYRSDFAAFRYSDRDPESLDVRTVLSNALLDAAQNDVERKYIADYQEKIQAMNEEQNRLNEIRDDIRNMTFGKAPHTKEHLKSLKEEATRLANRINVYDKQLLRIEAMKPMKAVIARETDKVKTRIKAEQAAFMADYKNRVSSREYIARIEHEVKGLRDRLLHPKAKTIIPEAFAKPAAEFLASIDFSTFNPDGTRRSGKANVTRAELHQRLDALAKSIDTVSLEAEYGQMDISPDMLNWIEATKKYLNDNFAADDTYVLRKMNPDQLRDLYQMVVSLRTAVNRAGKMYTNMSSDVTDLGVETIDYLKPFIGRERSVAGAKMYKTLGWDYAQPVTAFERFGGAGKTVFNGLLQGQKKEAENVQRILDFVDTAYTRDEVNAWREEMHEVKIGGSTYNVPTSYIQELYCMMKDEDARRHIVEGGGIRFGDLTHGQVGKRRTKTFENTMITESEVNAMIDMLTPRQKEVADNMQEFMDVIGAEWGNEISMKRFGYHAFGQITNYYPIKTIKQNSEYEAQQKRANIYALLNKSFTKERVVNANNAVIIGDLFKTFSDHMSEMAIYNSWALPVIDTIKWFNYREAQDLATGTPERSVKDAIRQAFGHENSNPADEYIRRLLESINSQKSGGLSESLAFHNLRMVNRVAVAGNIRVAVQQPFSITRAFEMISPKYIRPMTPKALKSEYAELVEHTSFGRWKGMGYYDVDISRPLEVEILKNSSFADRVTEKTMTLAEKGDQWTWTTLWHACKLEAKANGLTGDALLQAAGEKFDQLIAHTQVVDSVLTKSQWMRSDSFWHRMTSAFMSEPMTSYNTLLRRFDQFQRDRVEHGKQYAVSNNWKNIAKTAVVFAMTQAVNALVTAPIDAARDDDDYKTWLEKMLERFRKNFGENMIPTSMMPYISDIVEYAIYGSEDRPDLAMYTRVIDAAKQIKSLIDSYSVKKLHRAFMSGLSVVSSVTGLPMSNVMRDAVAIWNTVIGDVVPADITNYGSWKFQTADDRNKVGYQQFLKALMSDNMDRADYLYMQLQSNGVDSDTIYNGVKNLLRDTYGQEDVMDDLIKLREYFKEEDENTARETAEETVSWWDYMDSHPDRVLEASAYEAYYYKAMPSGIDVETYEDYYTRKDGMSKQDEIVPVIDSLPLTTEQKDALYLMKWKPMNLDKTPWHQ